jgi:hypothetical protein
MLDQKKNFLLSFSVIGLRTIQMLLLVGIVDSLIFLYLVNRIRIIAGEEYANKLSPWKQVNTRNQNIMGREQFGYELVGIQQADYLELFKKFGYSYGNQESFKLDHIGYVVLGDNKLSYEEYGSLHTLYKKDHQKFIDYNIKDVQLVDRIDQKMGLISLALTMAYKGGVNVSDTMGTTAYGNQLSIVGC